MPVGHGAKKVFYIFKGLFNWKKKEKEKRKNKNMPQGHQVAPQSLKKSTIWPFTEILLTMF